jgi:hypothetical protein
MYVNPISSSSIQKDEMSNWHVTRKGNLRIPITPNLQDELTANI